MAKRISLGHLDDLIRVPELLNKFEQRVTNN